MGWGGFLDQLLRKLPIQDRKERWKNRIEALEAERNGLLMGSADDKKAKRITDINNELDKLYRLCKTSA